MINTQKTVVDENEVNEDLNINIIDESSKAEIELQVSSKTDEINKEVLNSIDEMNISISLFQSRVQKIEDNNKLNKTVALQEFYDIGKMLEGKEIEGLLTKINEFKANKDIMTIRYSYKHLFELSLNLLNQSSFLLSENKLKDVAIKNLMGRIQEKAIT